MNPQLFPICLHGKYGFIDSAGTVLVPPQFDSATTFQEGLARIQVKGKWGFIDTAGNVVIQPTFDDCSAFSDGFAVVKTRDKSGYIDLSGDFRIEPKYYRCESFEDGIAKIQETMMMKPVFIDKTGTVVLDQHNYLLSHHHEGLINCSTRAGWGFINRAGSFVIPPKYVFCSSFYEGMAAVCLKNDEEFVFIDRNGKVVIDGPVQGADIRFSDGLCAVWQDERFGFIDRAGKLVIPYSFYFAGHFSEDHAVVNLGEGADYGYIDRTGQVVISPRFTCADAFEGGLAAVINGDRFWERKYGYIDRTGRYVWEPTR